MSQHDRRIVAEHLALSRMVRFARTALALLAIQTEKTDPDRVGQGHLTDALDSLELFAQDQTRLLTTHGLDDTLTTTLREAYNGPAPFLQLLLAESLHERAQVYVNQDLSRAVVPTFLLFHTVAQETSDNRDDMRNVGEAISQTEAFNYLFNGKLPPGGSTLNERLKQTDIDVRTVAE